MNRSVHIEIIACAFQGTYELKNIETCLLISFRYKYTYSVDGNQHDDCPLAILSTQSPVFFAHVGSDPAPASLETTSVGRS
jgi:hypothetical protein